jgi:hypothetical protein
MSYDTRFRGIVLVGLVGLFVAVYLLLYQMGFYGSCCAVRARVRRCRPRSTPGF